MVGVVKKALEYYFPFKAYCLNIWETGATVTNMM